MIFPVLSGAIQSILSFQFNVDLSAIFLFLLGRTNLISRERWSLIPFLLAVQS